MSREGIKSEISLGSQFGSSTAKVDGSFNTKTGEFTVADNHTYIPGTRDYRQEMQRELESLEGKGYRPDGQGGHYSVEPSYDEDGNRDGYDVKRPQDKEPTHFPEVREGNAQDVIIPAKPPTMMG